MKIKQIIPFICTMVLSLLPILCLAGPGGFIVKTLTETLLGKIVFGGFIVFLLPLFLYILLKEEFAIRRAQKDLRFMTSIDKRFDWLDIKRRVFECFYQVHNSWSKEDMSEATKYMTNWYWQNQQIVFLDRWAREGLKNICEIKSIKHITPILFAHKNSDKEHDESLLVIKITSIMKDYLVKIKTDKVVEGNKRFKEATTIWSFELNDDQWKVFNIEEESFLHEYVKHSFKMPKIEDTIINPIITKT